MGCIVINFRTRQIILKEEDEDVKPDAPKVTMIVPTSKQKESRKEQNDRIIEKLRLKGK